MAQVKLGLRGKPIPYIIEYCSNVVSRMTKNPNFPSPNPPLSDISGQVSDLSDAYTNALDGGKALKSIMKIAKEALLGNMSLLATYVQNISGGDETIIRDSGMGVRERKVSKQKPAKVQEMGANKDDDDTAEQALLKWKKVGNAKSYVIQMTNTPDVDASWVPAGVSLRTSITITGLVSGKNYWFRVAAIGTYGQGAWSEAARKMIN